MPLVIHPCSFACRGERLAGAASSPNCSIIRDASATEGVTPHSDASEKMNLSKSSKVIPAQIFDASSIDNARRNDSKGNKVFEPVCGVFVVFVVEGIRLRTHGSRNSSRKLKLATR